MNRPRRFLFRSPLLALLIVSPQLQTARAQAFSDADWLPLGSGLNNTVEALAVSGNTLYAGGIFPRGGAGQVLNGIAQWNGSSWSPLGSGVSIGGTANGWVTALAVSGSTLYVGGGFSMAGTNLADEIAEALLPGTAVLPPSITNVSTPEPACSSVATMAFQDKPTTCFPVPTSVFL